MILYLPIYGHHQPLKNPPNLKQPLTLKERENYHQNYHMAIKGQLPYEPSPALHKRLELPEPPLLIHSDEILRPPSPLFGHHNQVVSHEPQLTIETLHILHVTKPQNPVPRSNSQPLDHLLDLCRYWGIPLEGALLFLAWESRRLDGNLIYSFSELQWLNDYVDFEGIWRDRLFPTS